MVKKILHFRVQQTRLEAGGGLPANSTSWIEPEDIEYDRDASIAASEYIFVKKSEDGDEKMVEDEDIAVLTYDASVINLDTLTAPPGHALTGN